MSNHTTNDSDWWSEFFDNDYADYGLESLDSQRLNDAITFLLKTLDLQPGAVIFDQCCGIGRISLPLAERELRVIGVDQAQVYIERATHQADLRNLDCSFYVGDAFEFVSPEPCDAAINWFTSWGYSNDDERNQRMLQRAFDSLKPGGRFVMDTLNYSRIMAEFLPAIVDRPRGANVPEGLIILQENKPNFETGMLDANWTVFYPDGRRHERRISTRMYLPHTIASMLKSCGFEEINFFGGMDGEPLTLTSGRCIIVAKRR